MTTPVRLTFLALIAVLAVAVGVLHARNAALETAAATSGSVR
jgi:hypothetical protein